MRRVSSAGTVMAVMIALAALVLMGQSAWSQGGKKGPAVQGEVHVGPSGAPAASPTAGGPATPATPQTTTGGPVKRGNFRNPFIPPGVTAEPVTTRTPTAGGPAGKAPGTPRKVQAPPPPAPSFTLAGILQSGGYLKAMLNLGAGTVAEAKVGDVVQGYRVTSIDLTGRQVTVEMRKHAFKVKLPRETPYGTKGDAGAAPPPQGGSEKGSGGPPQGGPLPPPPPPAPAGSGKGK